MIAMSLARAIAVLHAEAIHFSPVRPADVSFRGIGTDTRTLASGNLFVALSGKHFDGHDFLGQAAGKGAVAAVVERARLDRVAEPPLPVMAVEDTRRALGELALAWREGFDIPLLAVTGSNGKTTVKEMLAGILGRAGQVLATRGNLNNDIGVPLTLFRLDAGHDYAVIEMGANHPGEIARLTRIARPTVALITQAGPAHLEGFGSIDGVARAKGEIFQGLHDDGVAVINADDPHAGLWRELAAGRRQLSFGFDATADVHASEPETGLQDTPAGERLVTVFDLHLPHDELRVHLPLAGRHNVTNAACAAAAALAAGATAEQVRQGLEAMQPVPGRLQLQPGPRGARLVDDTYNANPASLRAGIEAVTTLPGETWLVLGDMGELGDDSEALHAMAGRQARALGVRRLFTLGEKSRHAAAAFGRGAAHCETADDLVAGLAPQLRGGVNVLIKGSRGMHMEDVIQALAETGED